MYFSKNNELFFVRAVFVYTGTKKFNIHFSETTTPGSIRKFINMFGNDFKDVIKQAILNDYPVIKHSELSMGDSIMMTEKFIDNNLDNNLDINNPDAVYPFYFMYNDIKDYMENNRTSRNKIEFLDNDLYSFEKVINHAEKHKKRRLMSLENDINIIQENKKKLYYVDNEEQRNFVEHKLNKLLVSQEKQRKDYDNFIEIIRNVIFNKNIYKSPVTFPIYTDKLIKALVEELEIFYNNQYHFIESLKYKARIIYLSQKLTMYSTNDELKGEIKLYQQKFHESNDLYQDTLVKLDPILSPLDNIYQEIFNNSTPTTTFASMPDHIKSEYIADKFFEF